MRLRLLQSSRTLKFDLNKTDTQIPKAYQLLYKNEFLYFDKTFSDLLDAVDRRQNLAVNTLE